MTRRERIPTYLEHIADAIDRATAYTRPIATAEAFAQNLQALDAVVRTLEIIGEAANKIYQADPAYLMRHPEIPWAAMCTMRNKVIHDYFSVDPVIVWNTVKNDLPKLRKQIEFLLLTLPNPTPPNGRKPAP